MDYIPIKNKSDRYSLRRIIKKIISLNNPTEREFKKILLAYPRSDSNLFTKGEIIKEFERIKQKGLVTVSERQNNLFYRLVRMKKTRTISGVTPVTVFTKPYPCPGECIFCPSDVRMPKSYLSSEPAAQRAERNKFDPYYQTYNRLTALNNIGHPVEKVELIILGGTFSVYPKAYKMWFVKRCFDAMNDFVSNGYLNSIQVKKGLPFNNKFVKKMEGNRVNKSYNEIVSKAINLNSTKLKSEVASWDEVLISQKKNEKAISRCIGLTIETRPDEITKEEVIQLRKLGVTKVQIGIQSLNDEVLKKNKRGHDVTVTRRALIFLRKAGFKIQAHWMANLYGSNPSKDVFDFKKLFSDKGFRCDELKIYPCSLISNTELVQIYKKGLWKPYTEEELIYVLKECLKYIPAYCRLNRMIRDISASDIVVGSKKSNLREIVEKQLKVEGVKLKEIRIREIKDRFIDISKLNYKVFKYNTSCSLEVFIQSITKSGQIAGFLRLSLPIKSFIKELDNSALIRELHIYGPSVRIGKKRAGKAQHMGIGKKLMKIAKEVSIKRGFKILSVISAIGTKQYYRRNGFHDGFLYQHLQLI